MKHAFWRQELAHYGDGAAVNAVCAGRRDFGGPARVATASAVRARWRVRCASKNVRAMCDVRVFSIRPVLPVVCIIYRRYTVVVVSTLE